MFINEKVFISNISNILKENCFTVIGVTFNKEKTIYVFNIKRLLCERNINLKDLLNYDYFTYKIKNNYPFFKVILTLKCHKEPSLISQKNK